MSAPIDFYFDFSSPYSFVAHLDIEALAARHDRALRWRPILLGVAFKQTGAAPLMRTPLKGDYAARELTRIQRRRGRPFTHGEPFPFASMAPSRAYYWLEDRDPTLAASWAKRIFAAFYDDRLSVDRLDAMLDATAEWRTRNGVGEDELRDGATAPEQKQRLKDETAAAVAAGVFGAPFFLVDGEPFWGFSSLPDLDAWLSRGGW